MKPQLFIASSSEAVEQQHVKRLASRLGERFVPKPWDESLRLMTPILSNLIELTECCQFGLFLISGDAILNRRGKQDLVGSGNVILELGLFLGKHGPNRALFVVCAKPDDAVELPSDIKDIHHLKLTANRAGHVSDSEYDAVASRIENYFSKELELHVGEHADGSFFALQGAFGAGERWAREQRHLLAGQKSSKETVFESKSLCETAYRDALDATERRFKTTSLLSSGFWTQPSLENIAANDRMLNRLRGDQGGCAQRLFLLDEPADGLLDRWRREALMRRWSAGQAGVDSFRRELKDLRDNLRVLLSMGFEMRAASGDWASSHPFTRKVDFDGNCEFAIYDEFRLDIFEGGRNGRIDRLRCYTPNQSHFREILGLAESYFDTYWDDHKTIDAEKLIRIIDRAREVVAEQIDYRFNWLMMYEFYLPLEDCEVKAQEIDFVTDYLRRESGLWGRARRYLDIGTCTARYPVALYDAVAADGKIVAIDNDHDCVRFSKQSLARIERGREPKTTIREVDFRDDRALGDEKRFDLVTCMLGTVSHFGRKRSKSRPFADNLQKALRRMRDLTAPRGVLILGVWSQLAIDNRRFLRIYKRPDMDSLAAWSPPPDELVDRLSILGLDPQVAAVHDRLSVIYCRHN